MNPKMKDTNKKYDVAIIGGGAAGIMAAIAAKRTHPNHSVLIIDRTFSLGRKILVSGAGRCNLTNVNLKDHYKKHLFCENPELLNSVFSKFGYKELMRFFEELGIATYIETKTNIGKIFPITDSAKNIVALLEDEIQRLGVELNLNTEVTDIKKQNDIFVISINNSNDIYANKCIISVGGKTYPALGSDGSLYKVIIKLGHKIVESVPAAVPLTSKNRLSQMLQGVKLNIEVSSIINGKKIKTDINDVIFTQYGLSGSAILNISRDISIYLNRKHGDDAQVLLNFFPGKDTDTGYSYMERIWAKRPDQTLENSLLGLLPIKAVDGILEVLGFNHKIKVNELSDFQKLNLIKNLTSYKYEINGTRGWNEAEFTAGGINSNEINPTNLESKLIPGMYFAGEIIDCDGDIGGYNISWAFCSGYVAGLLG